MCRSLPLNAGFLENSGRLQQLLHLLHHPLVARADAQPQPESVLEQARKLVAAGYQEFVLTGIHTGGYGDDLEDYTAGQTAVGSGSNRRLETDSDQFD